MSLFKRDKPLSELEEESERLEGEDRNIGRQLSITQKREAIRQLKARGLTAKHFGGDFMRILKWIKEH